MSDKAKNNWVDYSEIKANVSLKMVLERYELLDELKPSGDNLVGCCPIHKGTNSKQFSVNLERNIFNCFGNCKGGGNVIDFVAKMEGISVREAAILLKEWFLADQKDLKKSSSKDKEKIKSASKPARKEEDQEKKQADEPERPNPPLNFTLKSLETEHPFFSERHIEPATVERFGLGFCTKGTMAGRIVIPIHNEAGELVAYCGRAVNEEQIEKEGKYKLPPRFQKSLVVYNLNRQERGDAILIVVESYLSVFRLYQHGFANTVALMGCSMSQAQEELISRFVGLFGRFLLIFDADEGGRAGAEDCQKRLSRKFFVKNADVSRFCRKPHQLTKEQAKELIFA